MQQEQWTYGKSIMSYGRFVVLDGESQVVSLLTGYSALCQVNKNFLVSSFLSSLTESKLISARKSSCAIIK